MTISTRYISYAFVIFTLAVAMTFHENAWARDIASLQPDTLCRNSAGKFNAIFKLSKSNFAQIKQVFHSGAIKSGLTFKLTKPKTAECPRNRKTAQKTIIIHISSIQNFYTKKDRKTLDETKFKIGKTVYIRGLELNFSTAPTFKPQTVCRKPNGDVYAFIELRKDNYEKIKKLFYAGSLRPGNIVKFAKVAKSKKCYKKEPVTKPVQLKLRYTVGFHLMGHITKKRKDFKILNEKKFKIGLVITLGGPEEATP